MEIHRTATYDQLDQLLDKIRKAIFEMSETVRNPNEVTIYMPDYLLAVFREYHCKMIVGASWKPSPEAPNGTFFGVRNVYPSATNEVTISALEAPLHKIKPIIINLTF